MRTVLQVLGNIALYTSLMLAPQAMAQSHGVVAHLNAINPYKCDVNNGTGYSSQLVNDNGHLVLLVRSSTDTNFSYFCDNAGGVARLTHPVQFDSISAWVKVTGDFVPTDVYVEIYADHNPQVFYFNTSNAIQGQTVNGYTLYTWTAKGLEGIKGFPAHPIVDEFGFSVNVYNIGAGAITGVTLNGHHIPFAGAHTLLSCPFSDSGLCVAP